MAKKALFMANKSPLEIISDTPAGITQQLKFAGLKQGECALYFSQSGKHKLFDESGKTKLLDLRDRKIRNYYPDTVYNIIQINTTLRAGSYKANYVSIANRKMEAKTIQVEPDAELDSIITFALEHIRYTGDIDEAVEKLSGMWNTKGWNLLIADVDNYYAQCWIINPNGVILFGEDEVWDY
jgi:hypothetical protein